MSIHVGDRTDLPAPSVAVDDRRPLRRWRFDRRAPLRRSLDSIDGSPRLATRVSWFILVGLTSTLFQGVLLFTLAHEQVSLSIAVPAAVLISGFVNFTLNYLVTWRDRFAGLTTAQRYRWFLPLFVIFAATTPTLWLKIAGITSAQALFGGPLVLSWVLSEGIGAFVNYIGADSIAFGAMARIAGNAARGAYASPPAESRMHAAWRAMRPEQWVKNVFVLAAAPFAFAVGDYTRLIPLAITTLAFCAASSSVYLVNDYMDRERDRQHPTKQHRPIASGALDGGTALGLSFALAAGSLTVAYSTHNVVALLVAVYLACSHTYSLGAKNIPWLDLCIVGSLYGLRTAAGFTVCGFDAATTLPWAFLATLLGVAVVTGKRRGEWRMLHGRPSATRPVLAAYSSHALPRLYAGVSAAAVLVATVTMWRITPAAALSAGLIAIGFARFWSAIESDDHDRNPQDLLLADRALCSLIAGYSGLLAVLLIVMH